MALFATIWTERTKNKTAKKNSFIEYQPFATYTSEHSRVLANKKKFRREIEKIMSTNWVDVRVSIYR